MQQNSTEHLFGKNQSDIPEIDNFNQSNLENNNLPNSKTDSINHELNEYPYQIDRLNNISLCLTIEVGQIHLSLKQLLELKLNDVLDFAGLPPKVKLMLNNVVIGDGYLVEFNGRLGVKISSLNTNVKLDKLN